MSNHISKKGNKNNKKRNQRKYGVSLKEIQPQTDNQERVFNYFDERYNLLIHGIAGTGKSFISCYLALEEILKYKEYKRITIVRSIVPTREMGHLPGIKQEKEAPYELPYNNIFAEICNNKIAYQTLKTQGIVNFMSTSHIRGITINDSIVIVDEMNNMNFHELDSIISRIGENCRIIFCGDYRQSDLKVGEKKGLHKFMKIINNMTHFKCVEFGIDDIVRSDLVKEYIIQKTKLEEK